MSGRLDGEIGPFLEALRGVDVADLTIEPAHLEEAFLEFYEGEDAGDADDATDAGPASPG